MAIIEAELLTILLAEPTLVARAREELAADQIEHRGIRAALAGLYLLHDAGQAPNLGNLQSLLDEFCFGACVYFEKKGQDLSPRLCKVACLEKLIERFRCRPREREIAELLRGATGHEEARGLLRQLVNAADQRAA